MREEGYKRAIVPESALRNVGLDWSELLVTRCGDKMARSHQGNQSSNRPAGIARQAK